MASIQPTNCIAGTGESFLIRSAEVADAAALLAHIRPLAGETEFFVEQGRGSREVKWAGEYVDVVSMYRFVKRL